MKLATQITTERGKPIQKTANEVIMISLTENRENRFNIAFSGDKIEILNYRTGKIKVMEY